MPMLEVSVPEPSNLEDVTFKTFNPERFENFRRLDPFRKSLNIKIFEKSQMPLWRFQTLSPEIVDRKALLS